MYNINTLPQTFADALGVQPIMTCIFIYVLRLDLRSCCVCVKSLKLIKSAYEQDINVTVYLHVKHDC